MPIFARVNTPDKITDYLAEVYAIDENSDDYIQPDFIDSLENKKLISRIPFNSGISKVVSVEAIKALLLSKK